MVVFFQSHSTLLFGRWVGVVCVGVGGGGGAQGQAY